MDCGGPPPMFLPLCTPIPVLSLTAPRWPLARSIRNANTRRAHKGGKRKTSLSCRCHRELPESVQSGVVKMPKHVLEERGGGGGSIPLPPHQRDKNAIAFGKAPRREVDIQPIGQSVGGAVSQAVSWASMQAGKHKHTVCRYGHIGTMGEPSDHASPYHVYPSPTGALASATPLG